MAGLIDDWLTGLFNVSQQSIGYELLFKGPLCTRNLLV